MKPRKRPHCVMLFTLLSAALGPRVCRAGMTVVATVDTPNTITDFDAWTITNDAGLAISLLSLTFTPDGLGNFDDNLPDQPVFGFYLNAASDPTGVIYGYANPSSAAADFNGWRTLELAFTDFDDGESLIFGQDTDGSIGTTPPAFGETSGDAFAGILELSVTLADNTSASAFFQVSGPNASTAVVVIPEPGTALLLAVALPLLLRRVRGRANPAHARRII